MVSCTVAMNIIMILSILGYYYNVLYLMLYNCLNVMSCTYYVQATSVQHVNVIIKAK